MAQITIYRKTENGPNEEIRTLEADDFKNAIEKLKIVAEAFSHIYEKDGRYFLWNTELTEKPN